MHLGVIASMKRGLEHFIFRELSVFSDQGMIISLFPTKFQPGLYNVKKEWTLHRWHPAIVILKQPYLFIKAPLRYLRLLSEAVKTHSLVDFMIAGYFERLMTDVDIIYSTFGDHKLYIGYYCKKILQIPLVVTIHAYELYRNPNPRLFVKALLVCDQIITVTNYNKALLIERFNIDPSKISVVRINVDTEDYRPQNIFRVLIVGFFAERKGHEVLFKAIRKLKKDDIEIWVVGDRGPEDDSIDVHRIADQLGIASQVAFLGKLSGNALKAVYRVCDVFCLPCHMDSSGVCEGFPTVLAEAMSFGKPVISTSHVEIPHIIDQIIVDENDVDGLAQAIEQVYQSAATFG
jgi:colanic acid/amylovoran biosynthesis glycosyltransferase